MGEHGLPIDERAVWLVKAMDYMEERATILREIVRIDGDRRIVDTIMNWAHDYHDDDNWYSCAQAASTWEVDRSPGTGCSDDERAGGPCDCGLDHKRAQILAALLGVYANLPVPGFNPEWLTV